MKAKTNILLVSPFFFPTNTYQQELCSRLSSQYPEIDISVLCYKTTNNTVDTFKNLQLYYVSCLSLIHGQFVLPNYLSLIKTLIHIKKEKKIKLLLCETRFFDSSWWVPIVAKLWKIPSVLVDHCASVPKHSFFFVGVALQVFDKLIARPILNSYSIVACSNKAVFDYLKSLGVKRLQLIGTGVDTIFFNPNKRVNFGDDVVVTFASRLIHTKGVELFYQAVRPLFVRCPNLKAVIAGEGPLKNEIRKRVWDDKLEGKVVLTGLLSTDELSLLLARTDIFVHPSFHHDGIPNVILEAGASSCLVIASNSGGTDEVIIHNKTGILIENVSETEIRRAIEEGILDKEKRLTLGKALRAMLTDQYNWEKVAASIRYLIMRLVSPL